MQAFGECGELRVGVHALTTGCFLNHLLEKFHDEYPDIDLIITEGTARSAQIMLREGSLDVAFMVCAQNFPDLASRVIWRDRLVAVVPIKNSLSIHREIKWRQLREEVFLVRNAGTGPQIHDLIIQRSVGRWPIPTIRRVDVERSTLMSMISIGHGISLFAEKNVPPGIDNVAILPVRDEIETVAFSAVWLPRNRSPLLKSFLRMTKGLSQKQGLAN